MMAVKASVGQSRGGVAVSPVTTDVVCALDFDWMRVWLHLEGIPFGFSSRVGDCRTDPKIFGTNQFDR
jgi:hypothetical protein